MTGFYTQREKGGEWAKLGRGIEGERQSVAAKGLHCGQ